MIDFSLPDEYELIARTAAAFAERELRPRQRDHEAARGVAGAVASAYAEAGFGELGAPESGTGVQATCHALERLGWGDAGAALALALPSLCRAAARSLALPSQLPLPAFVHATEFYELGSSSIPWLPMARSGPLLIFDLDGHWRLVGAETESSTALGLDAAGAVRVALGDEVARGDAGAERAARAVSELHLAAGALLAGLARASLEYTRTYVTERWAFGRPLAQHQAVAFEVAEMAIRTEAARGLLEGAAWMADKGEAENAVAAAYIECRQAALAVTTSGVQLLGGHGYMREHPVEKWMRDARALALLWGGSDLAAAAGIRACERGGAARWI